MGPDPAMEMQVSAGNGNGEWDRQALIHARVEETQKEGSRENITSSSMKDNSILELVHHAQMGIGRTLLL